MNYINCHQLKLGGRYSNSEKALAELDYVKSGCGKDKLMEECSYLEKYLQNTRMSIESSLKKNDVIQAEEFQKIMLNSQKKFNDLNCSKKLLEINKAVLDKTINKYTEFDKERIEAESKYQRNKRMFLGASVLLISLTMLILSKK